MSDISNWALPMPAPNPKVRASKPTAAERKLARYGEAFLAALAA